jgi:hypothetical protein
MTGRRRASGSVLHDIGAALDPKPAAAPGHAGRMLKGAKGPAVSSTGPSEASNGGRAR